MEALPKKRLRNSLQRSNLLSCFMQSHVSKCRTQRLCCGTLSERLRRQIRNLLGFARAGSNPAGVVLFHIDMYTHTLYMVQWPSGLRRSTQVRVSSEAWVRTPPEPHFYFFTPLPVIYKRKKNSAPSGSRTRVSTLGTLNDNRYTNGALGERFL